MEPFEWLVLGIGFAIGGLVGSRGKGLVRSAAKGYLVVEEKTREWTANMREDMRDAIEEARYEREQEAALHDEDAYEEREEEEVVEEKPRASSSRSKTGRSTGSSTATRPRTSTSRKRAGSRSSSARANGNGQASTDNGGEQASEAA
jgi:hypothetical protein